MHVYNKLGSKCDQDCDSETICCHTSDSWTRYTATADADSHWRRILAVRRQHKENCI